MSEVEARASAEVHLKRMPEVSSALSGSPLDKSLYRLQGFLQEKLTQSDLSDVLSALPGLHIHLGALGTKDPRQASAAPSEWSGRFVYPLKLYRSQLFIGPLFRPDWPDAPCPSCVEQRWFANRTQSEQTAFIQAGQTRIVGHNPRLTPFALETIWQILQTVLRQQTYAARPEHGAYAFTVLNLESLRLTARALMKDSPCPACALPIVDTPEAATIELQARPKREASSFRLVKAANYPLPFSALVNPTCGVLGAEIIPEFTHTLSAPVSGQFKVRGKDGNILAPLWSGRGDTYHESFVLGLLEGLERYAGLIPRGKQANIFESYAQLAPNALDPRECGLYQPDAYHYLQRFQPFSPDRRTYWVWGYSFRQKRPLLVPEELVYYLEHRQDYHIFVHDSSNGCAAGSCLEEAIFHGLLELIERDAFLLAWYARLSPPRIDPRSCCRAETLFVLENIERHGYELSLLDTRLDIRVPSVVSVVKRKESGPGNIMLAAGAGLNPEDAVRSALCEVACYVRNLRMNLEDNLDEVRGMARDFSKITQVIHHGVLYGLPEMAHHIEFLLQNPTIRTLEETYRDWAAIRPVNGDLRDDLNYCLKMVLDLGLDVIVVDQTCSELASSGLKAVSVIVPGLLPIDFGWKRERVFNLPRLRTVPRTAGFRATDFFPDPLNVAPHPFP
jgi:ribosomal protein S12 methylthiotransferase accessory factor